MTYEEALCFKLLLEADFDDSFFAWYDKALNEGNFNDLLLDLNFNISDKNKTIEILNNYILDAKEINQEKLFDLIWNEFHNLWVTNKITKENLIKTFYSIYLKLDNDSDVWFSVVILDDYFCHIKDGMVNEEKFNKMFLDFIERKTDINEYDVWNYKIQENPIKIKIKKLLNKD